MFNLLLALIAGLVLGWNFHSFFIQLNPPSILKSEIEFSKVSEEEIKPKIVAEPEQAPQPIKIVKPKIIPKIVSQEKNVSTVALPIPENFYTLLKNNLFSDAMSLYVDAKDTKIALYHVALIEYFEEKIKTEPQVAIEQMLEVHELHEVEPDSTKVNEEQFHDIEYSEDTVKQATSLLQLIKKNTHTEQEYLHQFSLQKIGEHFSLIVQINGSPVTLLLDTGASLTMVNERKLSSSLTVLKENIVLNTAGGEINAKLQEADTFSVGDIELEKFQVVSSSFEQKEADGLLGMNFFKKFKFKIDQEKALLFLSEK